MFCSKIGGECPHLVSTDENYVFCIMPFKGSKNIYHIIKTSIEGIEGKNFKCDRADKQYTNLSIWCKRICSRIRKAQYCVTDTTGMNPNVFYELGFAHNSPNTKTIIITQNIKDAPFDVKDLGHIEYSKDDLPKLGEDIKKAIVDIEKEETELDYIPQTSDEMIIDLKKQLREEEKRSEKFKKDTIESEKREKKLKDTIKELETIKKEPVDEFKRKISELQGTIAKQTSELEFAKGDKNKKENIIKKLELELNTKQIKLEEYKNVLKKYKKDKNEKTLSDIMITEEQIKMQSHEWFLKGLVAKNNSDKIIYYTKSIDFNPKETDAYNNRGNAYKELKNYIKAIKDYNQAIELNPEKAALYSNRGVAYCEQKYFDKALKDYNRALELDPEDIGFIENIIELFIVTNQFEKAIKKIRNNVTKMDLKDELIISYLQCIALSMLNLPKKEVEFKLHQLLKEDIIINWSFMEIDEWLNEISIEKSKKKYIAELTEKMKAKNTYMQEKE